MTAFLHPHQRPIRSRLRQWQQVRTWARLIREAEALWHVDVRALRRMGADELSQLIEEVPAPHRKRVNRWLRCYACLLYTSPSPRDLSTSRMPSSA